MGFYPWTDSFLYHDKLNCKWNRLFSIYKNFNLLAGDIKLIKSMEVKESIPVIDFFALFPQALEHC